MPVLLHAKQRGFIRQLDFIGLLGIPPRGVSTTSYLKRLWRIFTAYIHVWIQIVNHVVGSWNINCL